ncbi:hypothetical protein [Sporosarcina obsidiansis]|uniref:hypothetical protein n=1 Tax=Sporosarcina obsidiansis TaxID=2660748 RepID=UPI00129A37BC|nr:hypothetical protein [Sporosarcina obsidiansis]
MTDFLRPNSSELEFLSLSYNKFYDIYEEVMEVNDTFWQKEPYYRFSKVNVLFSIYAELLNYAPLKYVLIEMESKRPPNESKIAKELFKCIRNILAHFPFYETWNNVYINTGLVNWYKDGMTIDKFLRKNEGNEEIKYRFWDSQKKKMTYLSINFPKDYTEGKNIYLKDILNEKDGIQFSAILMKQVLDTQVLQMH